MFSSSFLEQNCKYLSAQRLVLDIRFSLFELKALVAGAEVNFALTLSLRIETHCWIFAFDCFIFARRRRPIVSKQPSLRQCKTSRSCRIRNNGDEAPQSRHWRPFRKFSQRNIRLWQKNEGGSLSRLWVPDVRKLSHKIYLMGKQMLICEEHIKL